MDPPSDTRTHFETDEELARRLHDELNAPTRRSRSQAQLATPQPTPSTAKEAKHAAKGRALRTGANLEPQQDGQPSTEQATGKKRHRELSALVHGEPPPSKHRQSHDRPASLTAKESGSKPPTPRSPGSSKPPTPRSPPSHSAANEASPSPVQPSGKRAGSSAPRPASSSTPLKEEEHGGSRPHSSTRQRAQAAVKPEADAPGSDRTGEGPPAGGRHQRPGALDRSGSQPRPHAGQRPSSRSGPDKQRQQSGPAAQHEAEDGATASNGDAQASASRTAKGASSRLPRAASAKGAGAAEDQAPGRRSRRQPQHAADAAQPPEATAAGTAGQRPSSSRRVQAWPDGKQSTAAAANKVGGRGAKPAKLQVAAGQQQQPHTGNSSLAAGDSAPSAPAARHRQQQQQQQQSSSSTKIPKLPMILLSGKWYRARLLKEQVGSIFRVRVSLGLTRLLKEQVGSSCCSSQY